MAEPATAFLDDDAEALSLDPLPRAALAAWTADHPDLASVASRQGFEAREGQVLWTPDGGAVVFGLGDDGVFDFGAAPTRLPPGAYRLADDTPAADATRWARAWGLGSYRHDDHRSGAARESPQLVWPVTADRAAVERELAAVFLVRDLVNAPANAMGPGELAEAAAALARRIGGEITILAGDDLLAEGYRLLHAVGRASPRAARLIDLRWGDPAAPRVTLVGKGVCFDTGGVNMKAADGMLLMKKDMAGAAHALALAGLIADAGLPLRLRVLIGAADNAVAGDAMRPLDVIRTRTGLTVEVGHTDAEGRLILCEALAEACTEAPDLLVDMATLTSAARQALGPDLPALFCNDDDLARELLAAASAADDPLWRLPLWRPYVGDLAGKTADLNNVAHSPYAGAIYAALFLQAFVKPATAWAHIDLFGWNLADRPGRPRGGEAQTLRALFLMLRNRCR